MHFKQFFEDQSLKNRNLKDVYRLIHRYGPAKRTDLSQLTNLTQTTLVRVIDKLLEAGFIYESGIEKSSGGRPPTLYQVASNSSYIIGIDISRTDTTIALIDISLQLVEKRSFGMTKEHTPELTIMNINNAINKFKRKYRLTKNDILGIGIGSVGPLDREKGIILTPEYFPADGWEHVSIVERIKNEHHVYTVLDNGANAAALGESYQLPSMNKNILYCISGIGLRCGILVNGQAIKNKIGDASSYGHMIIDISGKTCTCGQKGCLLPYISLGGIADKITRRICAGERSIISKWNGSDAKKITLEMIIKAGQLNDDLVHQVVLETAEYFGIGLANIVNLTQPEQVILNGKLFYQYPSYFDNVTNIAKKHIFHSQDTTFFGKGMLKENAVVIGAAALLFDSL